jgi:tetratricopeptide (TPR) repeat protein
MAKLSIDELEKIADVLLQYDAPDDLSQVVSQLSAILSSETDTGIRMRAAEALSKLAGRGFSAPRHSPEALSVMEKADAAFYSGNFKEAIWLYKEVLTIEPEYERAIENLEQANNYLVSGNFPQSLLPIEAAIAYGKARSYFHAQQYPDALKHMKIALETVRNSDLPEWWEGEQFLEQIKMGVSANNKFKNIVSLVEKGEWSLASQKINEFEKEFEVRPEKKEYFIHFHNDLVDLRSLKNFINVQKHAPGDEHNLQHFDNIINTLRQKYPSNPEIGQIFAAFQEAKLKQQEYFQLIQSAKLAIESANFKSALEIIGTIRESFRVSSRDVDELAQIAQTGLSLQKKYYELMGRGHHFMDIEDFESAMDAFNEAYMMIAGPLPTNNMTTDDVVLPEGMK